MAVDPSVQKLLDLLAAGRSASSAGQDIAAQRNNFRGLLKLAGGSSPTMVTSRDDVIAGPGGPLRLRLYKPQAASVAAGPGLLFLHGGGFYAGDLDTHDGICRVLAEASGCRIVAVDYRLAPKHPFPAAIEDGVVALTALRADPKKWGIDSWQLAIGGDSVGGNLAAVICQQWRSLGHPQLAAQLLICPALDAAGDLPSRRLFANGYYLEADMIAEDFARYCPSDIETVDPRLSPLRQSDLSGLPPAIIHAAECDPFCDEAVRYGERLREAGVAAAVTVHPGMIHLFYAFSRFIPKARAVLETIGRELGEVLSR
ncbi:MAG TPA: alpha/beta hydrolase [Pseudolabrys sp.]|nr:alpha/beta hydrolase [Pseudolabrys sp.]